jgi:squalene cyclase
MMLLILLAVGGALAANPSASSGEDKALAFLIREVPAWSRDNGCFSCHNNGDAARALYAASRKGRRIPAEALAATTAWIREPHRWKENRGDPGFSDKRLANVQFAAALLAAVEAGHIADRRPLETAARMLAADQDADGSWKIDEGATLGSPATYGTPLATWMALRVLKQTGLAETKPAVQRAEQWLRRVKPVNLLAASTLLLALAGDSGECLRLIRRGRTRDGGWGPYADSPPEVFDTAMVLLALQEARGKSGVAEMIRRGRAFLLARQNADGSWPATTRPSGNGSYAQMMSTTGWATLALLATRE